MRGKRISLGVGLATLALTGVGIAGTESSIRFEVVDLGSLGPASYPTSVNSRGEVVGFSTMTGDPMSNEHAFLWTRNLGMIDLGTLGGSELTSRANGLNDATPLPQVVGFSHVSAQEKHAFLWQEGIMTDLGVPGLNSDASAINNRGQVVGSSDTPGTGEAHAVLWEGGAMIDLGTLGGRFSAATDINEAGQVVGWATIDPDDSRTFHAFLWEDGFMTDLGSLPGGRETEAQAVNELAQVVGYDDQARCFAWFSGRMIELDAPDWGACYAHSLNNKGLVVGTSDSPEVGSTPVGFIWRRGLMVDLNTLTVPGTPWEIVGAAAVNDLVMIAGTGFTGTDVHAVLLVPQRFEP